MEKIAHPASTEKTLEHVFLHVQLPRRMVACKWVCSLTAGAMRRRMQMLVLRVGIDALEHVGAKHVVGR